MSLEFNKMNKKTLFAAAANRVFKNIKEITVNNIIYERNNLIKMAKEYDNDKINLKNIGKYEDIITSIMLADYYMIVKYHYDNKLLLNSNIDLAKFLLECTPISTIYYEEILNLKKHYFNKNKKHEVISKINKFFKAEGIKRKYKCFVCGKNANKVCMKCTYVSYCSKDCQKKNHQKHKKICKSQNVNKNEKLPRLMPNFYKIYILLKDNITPD